MPVISADRLEETENTSGGIEISADRLVSLQGQEQTITQPITRQPGQIYGRTGVRSDQTLTAQEAFNNNRPVRQTISNLSRPTLEMGGLTAGGIVGTAATPVAGTLAGAGLGYSMGSNLADRLDEFLKLTDKMDLKESSKKAGTDVAKGVGYEMLGQSTGVAASGTFKYIVKKAEEMGLTGFFKRIKDMFPTLSNEGILLKAKEALNELRKSDVMSKSVSKETTDVFERAGIKTKPTYAQQTGESEAAAFEQSTSAKNRELQAILQGRDAKINDEALQYISKQFPKNVGAEEAISGVEKQQQLLQSRVSNAEKRVMEATPDANVLKSTQDVGKKIKSTLETKRLAAKTIHENLYNQIPEGIELGAAPIKTTLNQIVNDYKKIGGGPDSFPEAIKRQIVKKLKATKGKTITFDNLRDWRSQIGTEINDQFRSSNPNLKLVRRLSMLKNGVEDAMEQIRGVGVGDDIAKLYDKATAAYSKYAKTYREGTVGEVLAAGKESSGGRITFDDIPTRFFKTGKMDAADDLIQAVGPQKAQEVINDYAEHEFISKVAPNGIVNTNVAVKWFNANRPVLEKYGLANKFKQIINTREVADVAIADLAKYEKTIASKVIGTDVDDVIKNIFSGSGRVKSAKTANELLNLPGIAGNRMAEEGIKNGFKDFLLKEIERTGVDVLQNPLTSLSKIDKVIKSYLPGMKVLYSKEPSKLKALLDYQKILHVLARNKNISYSGGSTTIEKAFGAKRQTANTIARNLGQIAAIQKGKGFMFGAIKNIWTAISTAPRKISEEKINALLTEAIYNPKIAQIIMDATKPYTAKIAQQKFYKALLSAGYYSTDKATNFTNNLQGEPK